MAVELEALSPEVQKLLREGWVCPADGDRFPAEKVKTKADLERFWADRVDLLNGAREFTPVETEEAMQALQRTMNICTASSLGDLCLENYRANAPRLKQAKGIAEIDGAFGRPVWDKAAECMLWLDASPAFLVAAGPSLDRNAHELARVEGRAPLFACDAALPILRAHGIEPDFALVIDPKPVQARFLEGVPAGTRTTLIASAAVHPDVLAAWPGRVLFCNTWGSDEDQVLQLEVGQDFGSIGVGGNVSTALLWLASIFCHANPIVLVGHDFSFRAGGPYYGRGGVAELAAQRASFGTWDIDGEWVGTQIALWSYKWFTEKLIQEQLRPLGIRVINATEGGVLGAGSTPRARKDFIEFRRLAEAIGDLIHSDRGPVDAGGAAPPSGVKPSAAVGAGAR